MGEALISERSEHGTFATETKDIALAKQIAEDLMAFYPGYLWAVHVNSHQGILDIKNLNLSGNYGMRRKLGKDYSSSSLRKDVMRWGGEILERYRMDRGKMNNDKWASLPMDFAGRTLVDLT